jgi:hypothetical protein
VQRVAQACRLIGHLRVEECGTPYTNAHLLAVHEDSASSPRECCGPRMKLHAETRAFCPAPECIRHAADPKCGHGARVRPIAHVIRTRALR